MVRAVNSGVITSTTFPWLPKSTEGKVLTAKDLGRCFALCWDCVQGCDEARWGNFLTVARGAAQEGLNAVKETDDAIAVMQAVLMEQKLHSNHTWSPTCFERGWSCWFRWSRTSVHLWRILRRPKRWRLAWYLWTWRVRKWMKWWMQRNHHSVHKVNWLQGYQFGYCTEIMVDLTKDVPNKRNSITKQFRNHLFNWWLFTCRQWWRGLKVHVHTWESW